MSDDAFDIFTGPYTQKAVLQYQVFLIGVKSLGLAAITTFFGSAMASLFIPMNIGLLLVALLGVTLFTFSILSLSTYCYIQKILHVKLFKYLRLIFSGVLVLLIVALFGLSYFHSGSDVQAAFWDFSFSPALNFVPVIGWAQAMITNYGVNWLVFGVNLCLLVVVGMLNFALITHIKAPFYEQALHDSEIFTNWYKKKQQGKLDTSNQKVHEATLTFETGEKAIFTKNMLILRKTRALFNHQELLVIGLYIAIAYFLKIDATQFDFMCLFWLMAVIMQLPIFDELQSYQIYIMPGNPFKKMYYLISSMLLKIGLMAIVLYTAAMVLFATPIIVTILNMLNGFALMLLMVAGNIVVIRLMKSRANLIVSQFIRIGIILVVMIPSTLISGILFLFMYNQLELYTLINSIINIVFNMAFAIGLIALCAPMLNGCELIEG